MTDFFSSPVGMALLAGCCTWAFTAFGAGMVYTAKSFSRRTLDVMLGFAAGVMIAASYWSLLAPALEMSSHLGRLACVPVALGFLAGAGVLRLVDLILPHIHPTENVPDGPPSKLPRSALLVFAITLHNIPPFALAFAAGAMIFVVVEEVIPESHASGHGDAASLGVIIGFVVMMCLDVALA